MRSLAWFLQRSINWKFCFRILFKTLSNKLAIKKVKGLHLNRSNFQELLLLAGTHYIIFIHTFDIPLLLFSFSISLDNIFFIFKYKFYSLGSSICEKLCQGLPTMARISHKGKKIFIFSYFRNVEHRLPKHYYLQKW